MKNIKKVLLLLICCFLNVNFCYAAASINVNYNDPAENSEEETGETEPIEHSLTFEEDDKYKCYFKYNITTGTSLTIHGYNRNNDPIIEGEVTPNEKIKAGTSIGIGIVEQITVGWEITDYWVTKKAATTKVFWINTYDNDSCERIDRKTCRIYNYSYVNAECTNQGYSYDPQYNFTCAKTGEKLQTAGSYDEIGSGEAETNEKKSECYEKAKGYVENVAKSSEPSESYVVTLNNPNTVDTNSGLFTITPKKSGPTCSGNSCLWEFVYSPGFVCINKKTAEVRYADSPLCGDNEFRIANDIVENVEHFHYFIPLNVATGEYSLLVNPKVDSTKKSKNWCIQAIRDNPVNYYDFLFTSTGGTYKAVPKTQNAAEKTVEDGCYVRTEIKIPVSDGIYNVVANNKINGYNFYVKNVNEYNPFPYPVTNTDSLWFEWYKNNYYDQGNYAYNNVEPNIKNSFKEKSYLVENVDAKTIRNINSKYKNLNTSYLNASLLENGTSTFINGEDGLTIKRFDTSYYKLGCGPINSGDAASNPLYQEGC